MPQNMDFELYFNIAFFAIIGLGFIIGYIRGLRKSLYSLIVTVIFYALFFITIEQAVNQLWVLPIPILFQQLTPMLPELAGITTIGNAVFVLLETNFPQEFVGMLSNEQFIAFITGISLFAVKLIYTILYFTVGQLVFKLLMGIIRMIFFSKNQAMDDYKLAKKQIRKMKLKKRDIKRMKKEAKLEYKQMSRKERRQHNKEMAKQGKKKRKKGYTFDNRELLQHMEKPSRKPLSGALMGAAKGTVSAFVTLIILGGMISMMDSLLSVLPEDQPTVTREHLEQVFLANIPVDSAVDPVPLASPFDVPAELEEQVDMARDIVAAFNTNIFVTNASQITTTSEDYDGQIPMHLFLFDSVLSFKYREETIMFRNEIDVISDTAGVLMRSEYTQTNDISDITSAEIIELFDTVSNSTLLTTLLPLGIEVGSDVFDAPVDIPTEELYEIDWQSELQTLGSVAAVGFDLVNQAGILNDETDLTTITLDGEEVQGLFDSLADSELATLAAFVAMEPILAQAGDQISAIITVPADLEWADEFAAFGQVAKAVLDTGITMDQLSGGEPMVILDALSTLDFTVLLESRVVTNALINVFSGNAGIEGLDMIVIPDGINWENVYDEDGNLVSTGELENILNAINVITNVAAGFDLNDLSFEVIADFDSDTIDTIFDSEVLVASISSFILEMDLGGTPLLIPDSVLDSNGYITSDELKAVANSASVLVTELACPEGDTACEADGFNIAGAFNLENDDIDTLLSSDIIGATVGSLVLDQGGDVVTVPPSALSTIAVDSVDTDVVSKAEIKNMFNAIGVLGFTDLENMTFDASIINGLALEADPTTLDTAKTDSLFGSAIVHATISTMLFDLTEGPDSVLAVPYFAEDGVTEIRYYDATDDMDYISLDELEAIMQALITLDISDFNEVDSLDIGLVIDNSNVLLESAILQATITKQVLDLGSEVISVPYKDVDDETVRVVVGNVGNGTNTEYILKNEITAILDALTVLGIDDINTFSGDVDMASITSDPANITTLLASATIHATISEQLFALDGAAISVPYFAEDDTTAIRVTVGSTGQETEYIIKSEIQAMIDVLEVLGITDNIDTFDGNVDIGTILGTPGNVDTLLASATIQATISNQLFDLETAGTLAVPYMAEDDTTQIRVTVGSTGTETEYVTEAEIRAMLDALDVLGITSDLSTFDGGVDMASITSDPNNIITLLASSTIQATISKQLIDLGTGGTLAVPFLAEDNTTSIRVTVGPVGNETEYVTSDEIKAIVDSLDIIGLTGDISTFDGGLDMANILSDPANIDTLLLSATIQATISDQLIDLSGDGTLILPYFEDDNSTAVRITVGSGTTETNYISIAEIKDLMNALDVLGLTTNLDTFDGGVDILSATQEPGNVTLLLASATIQATISKQLVDLDVAGTVNLPYLEEDGTTPVRLLVGDNGAGTDTEYITKTELETLINAMDILGINGDISSFSGDVDLSVLAQGTNASDVLASAMIQATVSDQVIDLTSGTLTAAFVVPEYKANGTTAIRFEVGDALSGTETDYVLAQELVDLIQGLDILGITDVTTFNGDISLDSFFDETNRNTLLESSIMQASISKQLIDLGEATLHVPFEDIDATTVRNAVSNSYDISDTEYVSTNEIGAIFEAFEVMGITNISNFTGTIDISVLDTGTKQDTLLSSASIHSTISDLLLDLDDAVLIVPMYSQAGETGGNEVRETVGPLGDEAEFVVKDEVKALIDSFVAMGFSDLNNFGSEIASGEFFTARATLLQSSSIQATISNKMINGTGGALIVPDTDVNDATTIRLEHVDGVTYIEIDELNAIFDGLEALGLTDFTSMNFNPATIFAADFDTVLTSAALQATISDNVLSGALNQNDVYSGSSLVVPTTLRETIEVDSVSSEHIEKTELKQLLEGLEALGFTDFGNSVSGGSITTMTTGQLDEMFDSGSIHITIHSMLESNAALAIPDLAKTSVATVSSITSEDEIRKFITAVNTLGEGNFATVSFDLTAIAALNATERETVADAMISRNTLHTDVYNLSQSFAYTGDPITAVDYMNSDTNTFFIKTTFLAIIDNIYPA